MVESQCFEIVQRLQGCHLVEKKQSNVSNATVLPFEAVCIREGKSNKNDIAKSLDSKIARAPRE